MKATIRDVAKLSNVSATTVSMILNGKPIRTSKETRKRVLAAAKELGYTPNSIAVALITKKTHTVGLVMPNITNFFFSDLSKNIESELDAHNYSLLFGNTMGTSEKDLDYLELFLSRGVDGVIFVRSSRATENYLDRFESIVQGTNVPIVVADRVISGASCCSVSVDNELGGYLATKHLLELGHRKIGCITAEPTLQNVVLRLSGYKRAIGEYGIPFDPELVVHHHFSFSTGKELAPELVKKGVTAIFAFNDMIGAGAYRACRELGLSVPEDISVVGYDDISLAQYIDVPLTTIHQPIEAIAKETVSLVMSLIDDNDRSYQKKVVLEPTLVVRDSTAPPKE